MIRFILPMPPSVNKLYSTVNKIRCKSSAYNKWIKVANKACNEQVIPQMMERCIAVYSLNHPNNSRERDAENYCKAITDLIVERGVLQDDSRRHLQGSFPHWNDKKGGQVFVSLYTLPEFSANFVLGLEAPFSLS